MDRRDDGELSLEGAFCGACGMYNAKLGACRACGEPVGQPPQRARAGFDADDPAAAVSWGDAPAGFADSPVPVSTDCPNCGFPRPTPTASCEQCGLQSTLQVWRRGADVIARKGAPLTHACVKCGSTDGLRVVSGRVLAGIETGGLTTLSGGLPALVAALRTAFAGGSYELPVALCSKHAGLARWIGSRSRFVSVAALSSVLQVATGSAEYRRFRGMAKGFRETLPEWVGPFPPSRKPVT